MKKAMGIFVLFLMVAAVTAVFSPRFCMPYNLQNLMQRTALFGILGIGVSFVIMTGGIDLSLGSLVALVGNGMSWLLMIKGWSVGAAVFTVLGVSLVIGLIHGLLVAKVKLQPFVVTLCGLLIYRGLARWLVKDKPMGFGTAHDEGLRELATSQPLDLPVPFISWIAEGNWSRYKVDTQTGKYLADAAGKPIELPLWTDVPIPLPFIIMVAIAILAAIFLNRTVWGRYILAVGRNEDAVRYSGIRTGRVHLMAYAICALLGGLGGVLFALDLNTLNAASDGNFYELYAIAAAVLGGCSLRGGEGSIFGVIVGTALIRLLMNSINMLGIPSQLEFVIIGLVLLLGVAADTLFHRARSRKA